MIRIDTIRSHPLEHSFTSRSDMKSKLVEGLYMDLSSKLLPNRRTSFSLFSRGRRRRPIPPLLRLLFFLLLTDSVRLLGGRVVRVFFLHHLFAEAAETSIKGKLSASTAASVDVR